MLRNIFILFFTCCVAGCNPSEDKNNQKSESKNNSTKRNGSFNLAIKQLTFGDRHQFDTAPRWDRAIDVIVVSGIAENGTPATVYHSCYL